jgi:hypothetical protein
VNALINPGAGDYVLIWAGPQGAAGAPLHVAKPAATGSPERGLLLQVPVERDGRGDVALIGNLALRRELLAMLRIDRAIRMDIVASGAGQVSPELQKRMAVIDASTNLRLREIVQKHGWPARDLVGLDGAAAAMTMVQHVPAETQRHVLPAVEAAFHAGTVRGLPEEVRLAGDRARMDPALSRGLPGSRLARSIQKGSQRALLGAKNAVCTRAG